MCISNSLRVARVGVISSISVKNRTRSECSPWNGFIPAMYVRTMLDASIVGEGPVFWYSGVLLQNLSLHLSLVHSLVGFTDGVP